MLSNDIKIMLAKLDHFASRTVQVATYLLRLEIKRAQSNISISTLPLVF